MRARNPIIINRFLTQRPSDELAIFFLINCKRQGRRKKRKRTKDDRREHLRTGVIGADQKSSQTQGGRGQTAKVFAKRLCRSLVAHDLVCKQNTSTYLPPSSL